MSWEILILSLVTLNLLLRIIFFCKKKYFCQCVFIFWIFKSFKYSFLGEFHTKCSDHMHPLFPNSYRSRTSSLPTQNCFPFKKKLSSPIGAPHIFFDVWASTRVWSTYQGLHSWENGFFFSQKLLITNRSLTRWWDCTPTSVFHAGIWSGLGIQKFSMCCHNCNEFTCVTTLLCSLHTVSL